MWKYTTVCKRNYLSQYAISLVELPLVGVLLISINNNAVTMKNSVRQSLLIAIPYLSPEHQVGISVSSNKNRWLLLPPSNYQQSKFLAKIHANDATYSSFRHRIVIIPFRQVRNKCRQVIPLTGCDTVESECKQCIWTSCTFIPSRVSGRGYKIGPVCVCVCVSVCLWALSQLNRLTYRPGIWWRRWPW